jgi:hypothetical protein
MYLLLHVDDFIICDNSNEERKIVVDELEKLYKLKDLGEVKRFLSYEVTRDREKKLVKLHHFDYIAELLELSGMKHCAGSKNKGSEFITGLTKNKGEKIERMNNVQYRSITGSLIHLSIHGRPDISFEVSTLCKYNSNPGAQHWNALKQLLKYLKYTAGFGLTLGGNSKLELHGYSDSGHASDSETSQSPGGWVFFLGTSMIAHKSKWFSEVFPSSTESEIASLYHATSLGIWLSKILKTFNITSETITIREDNQGCIKYQLTNERAGRMRHINVKYHWIREKIEDKSIRLVYCNTKDNVADIFTKSLRGESFLKHCKSLGMEPVYSVSDYEEEFPISEN